MTADFMAVLQRGIRWPYEKSFLNPTPTTQPPRMLARRKATSDSFYSQKMRRPVMVDSTLEQAFYASLETLPEVLFYQEQPAALTYEWEGRAHTYYPDILISFVDGRSAMAELKPDFEMATYRNLEKWTALVKNSELAGHGFFIGNTRHSMTDLLSVAHDPALMEILQVIVERQGTLPWSQLKDIRIRSRRTNLDLAAAIIQAGLVLEERPFILRAPIGPERLKLDELRKWFEPPIRQVERPRLPRYVREMPENAYRRWTRQDDEQLASLFGSGATTNQMAVELKRHRNAISKRLIKLGLKSSAGI